MDPTRALWVALDRRQIDAAIRALRSGADVNSRDEYGRSPLMRLCNNRALAKQELFDALIENGADLNFADEGGATALSIAAYQQNIAAVRMLLATKRLGKPIDVNHRDNFNMSPVARAIEMQNPAIAEALLADPDTDPNLLISDLNCTVLFLAAKENVFDIVRLLLANPRTDPNLGKEDLTPLHIACFENATQTVKLLLADPRVLIDKLDRWERRPIDMARQKKHVKLVELLLPRTNMFQAPPLATEQRHFAYTEVPKITNLISLEETHITTLDNSNMIFKYKDSFFARTKESIMYEVLDDDHVLFECKEQTPGAPSVEQVYRDRTFFVLTGGPINLTIPYDHILGALSHPQNTFEVTGPEGELAFTSDYKSVLLRGETGFKRRVVSIMSGDHCQEGTNKQIYELHPLVIVAAAVGGRRNTRRKQHRRRKQSRRRMSKRCI